MCNNRICTQHYAKRTVQRNGIYLIEYTLLIYRLERHQIAYDILRLKRVAIVDVNGNSSAEERWNSFEGFFNGKTPLAICTDIWARGIDVPSVKVVINFELPTHSVYKKLDKNRYVYRMGRASRFGKLLAFVCKA